MIGIALGEVLTKPLIALNVFGSEITIVAGIQSLEVGTGAVADHIISGRFVLTCRGLRRRSGRLLISADHVIASGIALTRAARGRLCTAAA